MQIAATLCADAERPLPEDLPVGLTGEFARGRGQARANQRAFLGKNGLAGPSLDRVVTEVGEIRHGAVASTHVPRENADDVHR